MTTNKYFNRISVSSPTFASTSSPDVSLGFQGSISLVNEGTGTVEYSFDGVTLGGDLVPGTASGELVFNNPGFSLIWFRLQTGATSNVRVEGAQGGLTIGTPSSSGGGGGTVTVSNFPATQPVSGTVAVSNFPSTQPVSGSVSVTGPLPSGTNVLGHVVTDTGSTTSVSNFPSTQTVSGSVSVSNFPATQPVSGSISVSNFPVTQPVSGSISVTGPLPSGSNVIGHMITDTGSTTSISNFPATQPVSGTVTANIGTSGSLALDASVTGLSAKFGSLGQKASTGSAPVVLASDQPSVPVTVGNFPATQPISGSVSVSNFPATQPVSGTVSIGAGSAVVGHVITDSGSTTSISNFPATQPISAAALPLPTNASNSVNQATVITLLNGGLPAALGTNGGLKVESPSGAINTVSGTAAAGAAASGNPVPVAGKDGSGNIRPILTSTTGLTRTTYEYGVVPTTPWLSNPFLSLPATGLLVKSGAGILRYLQFVNSTGATSNIMFFDRTTAPSGGAVPLLTVAINSASSSQLNLFEGGVPFSTGIYVAMSSTLATYTAIASTAVTGVIVYA